MTKVFSKAFTKSGSPSVMILKFSRPDHCESMMPMNGW